MNRSIFPKLCTLAILMAFIVFAGCEQKVSEKDFESKQVAISTLEREIESRLREYENHLRNGDSTALGDMYMENAEIIPSTVGRQAIISVFGHLIRDSITGSSFKTTQLWGNDQLLVEDGTGTWSHANGTVVGRGRYLLVWVKGGGKWKIVRDTWFPEKEE